jgi:RNA polymerase sigma-70 factor (ECF subfamily)
MTTPPLSDGPLVAAARAGDEGAFAALVERYHAALLRAAISRLGRVDWSEDAVQETFFCVFKSLHTYDSRFSFRTWLWTILIHQCHRQFAKQQRHTGTGPANQTATPERPSPEPSPADRLLAQERAGELSQLLTLLPEPQADALRLRFFGELKYHEIAAALGCSVTAAKNRVRTGLEQLSVWLSSNASARNTP